MKILRALAATALTAGALTVATAAPAQATCYGYNYSYSIDSTHIQATSVNRCTPGGGGGYMVLYRWVAGTGWTFVTTGTGYLSYDCVGTAPNMYQIGPIVDGTIPGSTWYQFNDNCS
ncbi:hypothetical protein [Catellatospora methionotrophica]|uniref:hypothetical protein n=1 Tax=Catellatospora methionotrophica TaxID=121620 RepID=UPI0033F83B5E